MSLETQVFKAQRVDLREKRQRLDLSCRNSLDALRAMLNPALPVVEICEDKAVDCMIQFAQQVRDLRDIDSRIRILNNQLEM